MEEDEEILTKDEVVSVSINRFSSGVSYRLSINGAKTFDDAIQKLMEARKKLIQELEKAGEKVITEQKR